MSITPRGGGTGCTGGAILLHAETAVVNTEKPEQLGEVECRRLPGIDREVAVVRAEEGVVTCRGRNGLAFAVDPTSQDACTFGGDIAMNAGGKKAVLRGTTLDNLVSRRMVNASGHWIEVERIGHNLGKIPTGKEICFRISEYLEDGITLVCAPRELKLPGSSLRRSGLGKDVTDKLRGSNLDSATISS